MLRIIQNRSSAAAKNYYAHSDYLSEGQELTGVWGGKAARLLGLSGEVGKLEFDRLCDNLHPHSGSQLTLRNSSDRTTGYDFNFHCPKGVSIAYAMGKDDRIRDVFVESYLEVMDEMEPEASTRVRKHGADTNRTTGNLAWASFVHTTARPVDGVPDPHLHGHVFVFNSTWDSKENAWKAGQFRNLKRDASYFEASFHSRLAGKMQALGYTIVQDGKNWDIAEIPSSLKAKFSRRTDQIEKLAESLGITDAEQKAELASKSRESKAKQLSMSDLRQIWERNLSESEKLTILNLRTAINARPSLVANNDRESEAIDFAKAHCFERHSIVPEKHILTEALRFGVGRVTVQGIKDQLNRHQIITREVDGMRISTTPEMLREEAEMIHQAIRGRGQSLPLNPAWNISRDWLNPDQQNAVQHVLNAKDKVIIIRGGAGTGKTAMMKEAVEGIQHLGRKVYTFAPSAEASRGVLAGEGFDATTVAELLVSKELQEAVTNNVIWVDEAGLLGTRAMKKLLDISESRHARLILSGDWKQHGSVEAGAALRILEQQGGIKPALIQSIQRQTGQYKEAVALLAEGNVDEAFSMLDNLGWLNEVENDAERNQAIANDYVDALSQGKSVLVVSPTHAEGSQITDVIRNVLKDKKLVDPSAERQFEQLLPARLTTAEKQVAGLVSKTDLIVFTNKATKHKRGERIDAKLAASLNLAKDSACFEAYQRKTIALTKGDLIRITANGKTLDAKHRLNNGAVYKIKNFTPTGDIQLSNGWVVGKDYGFIAPGYVTTSHSSQGKTVDLVLIAESQQSFRAADREQFYVSVSRGRHGARIYTNSIEELKDAVVKTRPRVSALELVRNSEHRLRIKLDKGTKLRNPEQTRPSTDTPTQKIAYG